MIYNTKTYYSKQQNLFNFIKCDNYCKICGNSVKGGSSLSTHLRKKHNTNFYDYILTYYKIDIKKLIEEGKEIAKENKKIIKEVNNLNKFILKGTSATKLLHSDFSCKICKMEFKNATYLGTHIKTHNITFKEYLLNYFDIDVDKINKNWEDKKEERLLAGYKLVSEKTKGRKLSKIRCENIKTIMKGVFSKPWFLEKYGEIEGIKKYNERSKLLSRKTFWRKYNKENKENWSKISQELFWEIYKRISNIYTNIYFGELNHEFSCGIQNCNFDFVVNDIKKVIEFNGDKFHANPMLYSAGDIPLKFIGLTAQEIWNNDEIKIKKLENKNYDVKIIWELAYCKNKDKIILECIDFLLIK